MHMADMRYVGQSYKLTIPLPGGRLGPRKLAGLLERFHQEHERLYGFHVYDEPVEVVALRLSAIGKIARPPLDERARVGDDAASAQKALHSVYFAESGGFTDCHI